MSTKEKPEEAENAALDEEDEGDDEEERDGEDEHDDEEEVEVAPAPGKKTSAKKEVAEVPPEPRRRISASRHPPLRLPSPPIGGGGRRPTLAWGPQQAGCCKRVRAWHTVLSQTIVRGTVISTGAPTANLCSRPVCCF